MIRRKLPTTNLKIKNMVIGKQTKTKIGICYLDDIVNKEILNELTDRLSKIDFDGILDSGFITELIEDSPYSPFDTVGSTERPDIAALMMLDGHIVVIVDGSPSALTVPFLFEEYFKANDDYYINFYYSSISRMLRFLSFIITILLPAAYVAILTFHQEMIPSPLLFSISAAREGIPLPTVIETLGLLVVFEIMREVGMRVPIQIGQALSILGALVLGTAALIMRNISEFVRTVSLPETPECIFAFFGVILVIYTVRGGVELLGRFLALFFPIYIALIIIVTLMAIPLYDLSEYRSTFRNTDGVAFHHRL